MQKRPSFSLYGFIIAILVHIIVALLLAFIEKITPTPPPPPKDEKPVESRFKVSLKEQPQAKKEALVKNNIPKPTKARPIPKGKQLETPASKIIPQKQSPTKAQQPVQSAPAKPAESIQQQAPVLPPEPKKAFERHIAKKVATIDKVLPPSKSNGGLYDILSKTDENPKASIKPSAQISNDIKKLYGDKFGELSEGEQRYILDNQEQMRRITQATLDRYGRSKIPDNLRVNEANTIEFYLHPDGHISDIRFLKNSQFALLDDTTQETIEIAYAKYPRPAQKTYIRYRVFYSLQ